MLGGSKNIFGVSNWCHLHFLSFYFRNLIIYHILIDVNKCFLLNQVRLVSITAILQIRIRTC
jgi:hypothetical protein